MTPQRSAPWRGWFCPPGGIWVCLSEGDNYFQALACLEFILGDRKGDLMVLVGGATPGGMNKTRNWTSTRRTPPRILTRVVDTRRQG